MNTRIDPLSYVFLAMICVGVVMTCLTLPRVFELAANLDGRATPAPAAAAQARAVKSQAVQDQVLAIIYDDRCTESPAAMAACENDIKLIIDAAL